MRVSEIMTVAVKTVSPSDTVQKAAEIMKQIDCGSVPVTDNGQVEGMITDRDIAIGATAEGKGANFPVKSCMSKPVVTVSRETDAREAADIMADHQVRRLPVVENGKLVGILAIADLVRVNIFVHESGQTLKEISEPTGRSSMVQH